ncbi:putative carboxysome-like ethanolaminosome structural protein, ethanolamine utilization protein (fragment) [Kyrpidia spormannii]|uniref:Putative carboxysome-like ethanolaminosome structural protein, ethanolamine utilization protein n=1 Tax=Kyrpidia spormannii TaxID=2055160 RepID=A0A6F9EFU3_9BACL
MGDMVIVTQGSSARLVYGEQWPIDAAVIGIVDSVEKGG